MSAMTPQEVADKIAEIIRDRMPLHTDVVSLRYNEVTHAIEFEIQSPEHLDDTLDSLRGKIRAIEGSRFIHASEVKDLKMQIETLKSQLLTVKTI